MKPTPKRPERPEMPWWWTGAGDPPPLPAPEIHLTPEEAALLRPRGREQ